MRRYRNGDDLGSQSTQERPESWLTQGPQRRCDRLVCSPQFADDVLERVDDLVLLDLGLPEAQAQIERLGGWLEGKVEELRSPRFGLGRFVADVLTRRAALARQFFDQG